MSDGEYDWIVGEEVAVTAYHGLAGVEKIDRLTATQVIIGSRRYARKNGHEIGCDRWYRGHISRDARRIAQARAEAKRRAIIYLVERRFALTRESIQRMRKIADQAEAFLREAGEWESAS